MAIEIVQRFIDDIDGVIIPDGEAHHVLYSVGRKRYEMHLNDANYEKFMEQMNFYIERSREFKPEPKAKTSKKAATKQTPEVLELDGMPKLAAPNKSVRRPGIKAWAEANGYGPFPKMGGRMPEEVTQAYDEAHGKVDA